MAEIFDDDDDWIEKAAARDFALDRSGEEYAKRCDWEAHERGVLTFNDRYAVVDVRGSVRILKEITATDGSPDYELMSLSDFRLEVAARRHNHPVTRKPISLAEFWLRHEKRRQYDGITFAPGRETARFYNTWRGWPVPAWPGDCTLYKAHLLDNVCAGNRDRYDLLFAHMAHAVQRPEEPPGISIVLGGPSGVGKTFAVDLFGRLFGHYYLLIDNAPHLVGTHNSHLERRLMLHLDEVILTANSEAESRLKSIATARSLLINPKFLAAYQAPNYIRTWITTDQKWAVPAGLDDRRFFILDVAAAHQNDHAYFAAIHAEAANGGLEALMHELRTFDLSRFNLRQAPPTEALRDQKLNSMKADERWWYGCLYFGSQLRGGEWQRFVSSEALYEDYCRAADRRGIRTRSDEIEFGHTLRGLYPSIRRTRRRRAYGYLFESLPVVRAAFETVVRHRLEWPCDEADPALE